MMAALRFAPGVPTAMAFSTWWRPAAYLKPAVAAENPSPSWQAAFEGIGQQISAYVSPINGNDDRFSIGALDEASHWSSRTEGQCIKGHCAGPHELPRQLCPTSSIFDRWLGEGPSRTRSTAAKRRTMAKLSPRLRMCCPGASTQRSRLTRAAAFSRGYQRPSGRGRAVPAL